MAGHIPTLENLEREAQKTDSLKKKGLIYGRKMGNNMKKEKEKKNHAVCFLQKTKDNDVNIQGNNFIKTSHISLFTMK